MYIIYLIYSLNIYLYIFIFIEVNFILTIKMGKGERVNFKNRTTQKNARKSGVRSSRSVSVKRNPLKGVQAAKIYDDYQKAKEGDSKLSLINYLKGIGSYSKSFYHRLTAHISAQKRNITNPQLPHGNTGKNKKIVAKSKVEEALDLVYNQYQRYHQLISNTNK